MELVGSVFIAARLILLASVVAVLGAIVWEFWKNTKDLAIQLSHSGDLREDLLLGEVTPDNIREEHVEMVKEIRVDLAAPYQIPESLWKARGETPRLA